MNSLFQALKGAKGLGSGHNGTHHFIVQRGTAIMLSPLALYFCYAVVALVGCDNYQEVIHWFANPINSGLAASLVCIGFYHGALGMQVIIEDYVHHHLLNWLCLTVVKGGCFICALVALIAIIKLSVLGFIA